MGIILILCLFSISAIIVHAMAGSLSSFQFLKFTIKKLVVSIIESLLHSYTLLFVLSRYLSYIIGIKKIILVGTLFE